MKKNGRLWKELARKVYTDPNGDVRWIKSDPSLRSQLAERSNLVDSVRAESYLEACRRAPNASEGTKRKWRKALGIA